MNNQPTPTVAAIAAIEALKPLAETAEALKLLDLAILERRLVEAREDLGRKEYELHEARKEVELLRRAFHLAYGRPQLFDEIFNRAPIADAAVEAWVEHVRGGVTMKDHRTDEQLNRIIADWCGWKWVEPEPCDVTKVDPHWRLVCGDAGACRDELPNYCQDLNAVHEAENKLRFSQRQKYYSALREVFSTYRTPFITYADIELCMTDSRQRAEALVRVIEEELG